jgi:hypothetical protein
VKNSGNEIDALIASNKLPELNQTSFSLTMSEATAVNVIGKFSIATSPTNSVRVAIILSPFT